AGRVLVGWGPVSLRRRPRPAEQRGIGRPERSTRAGRLAEVGRWTVLVVGGEDRDRAVLVSLLRGAPDLAAAGARTVEEALEFLRGIRVHLVLLDLRAPEGAGA